jgi:hypothetical protein
MRLLAVVTLGALVAACAATRVIDAPMITLWVAPDPKGITVCQDKDLINRTGSRPGCSEVKSGKLLSKAQMAFSIKLHSTMAKQATLTATISDSGRLTKIPLNVSDAADPASA